MNKGNLNHYIDNLMQNADEHYYTPLIERISRLEIGQEHYLELSHWQSFAYQELASIFKQGDFISDDPFEALLEYFLSQKEQRELKVFHQTFKKNKIQPGVNEKYNAVFSFLGLSFDLFYTLLDHIFALLKVNGVFVLEIPCYWYMREQLTEIEQLIIDYSKQNEKKWLFVQPVQQLVEENKGQLELLEKTTLTRRFNRKQLAYLSSLDKLQQAEIKQNQAHLEICPIPRTDIVLPTALMVIRKKEKTLTRDNLFNL